MENYMKRIIFFAILFLLTSVSCQPKKEDFELSFCRFSIREGYCLSFNSSDTVYLVENPDERQNKFAIIDKNEKIRLENIISSLLFPDQKSFFTDDIDGLSYDFVYKKDNQKKTLSIHANAGPKEFWEFGNFLEEIKNKHKFIKTNNEVN